MHNQHITVLAKNYMVSLHGEGLSFKILVNIRVNVFKDAFFIIIIIKIDAKYSIYVNNNL